MIGCIVKRRLKSGISWGYSFFAGWDVNGKRMQIFRSGFSSKTEAATALRLAISDHEEKCGKLSHDIGPRGDRTWGYVLGKEGRSGFESKADAQRALLLAITAREPKDSIGGNHIFSDDLRFDRYLEHWLNEHAGRRCAPKTMERYRELGCYLGRHLGKTPLNELSTPQIQSMIHQLQDSGGRKTAMHPNGRPLAPKTVRHIGTLLYTCLSEAQRLNLLTVPHPMANKRVRLPKLHKRKPLVLDAEKLGLLFSEARSTRLFPLVVMATATGCRRGELLALQWTDLDRVSGELNVSKSLEQTKEGLRVKGTKSGEPRQLPCQSGHWKFSKSIGANRTGIKRCLDLVTKITI